MGDQRGLSEARELHAAVGSVHALSPLAILARGYSITRRWPDLTVLRMASDTVSGETVHIRLASGELLCEVRRAGEKLLPD
ncbi:MAG: exodeoxyribonuclease VII large subunit [Nitrospirota bacterium]